MYVLPGDSKAYAHCSWPFDGTPSPDDSSIGAVAAAGVIRTAVDFIPVPRGRSALECADERRAEAEVKALVVSAFRPILSSAKRGILTPGRGKFRRRKTTVVGWQTGGPRNRERGAAQLVW